MADSERDAVTEKDVERARELAEISRTRTDRALDLGYDAERLERDERRGLEVRAATLTGSLLVVITVLAGAATKVDFHKVSDIVRWLMITLLVYTALFVAFLATRVALATTDVRLQE